jgi:uncharacterized SAM-binding protein YcdF (DUF218 family)
LAGNRARERAADGFEQEGVQHPISRSSRSSGANSESVRFLASWFPAQSDRPVFRVLPGPFAASVLDSLRGSGFLRRMFFWLKKVIGYWLMPVPACLALFAIGVVLLWRKRTRSGRIVLTTVVVLFALLSNKYVSAALIRPLEFRLPPVPELSPTAVPPKLAACRFVVVLGAGNGFAPGLSALADLSTSARARITEAVRILRVLPDAKLLVSGPAEGKHASHATVLERAAVSLGVDPKRIERIEHARDTEDEANAVRKRVGDAPVALVTSAWHMPRAAGLFAGAGVDALPCPTDYTSYSDGQFHWRDFLWDIESLQRSSFAIRERTGLIWVHLRGKAGP